MGEGGGGAEREGFADEMLGCRRYEQPELSSCVFGADGS